jgi:hypothetical protein
MDSQAVRASMVRKLAESDVTTQWTLNYSLNSKLRMQFQISSAPPYPKTLMFFLSSDPVQQRGGTLKST